MAAATPLKPLTSQEWETLIDDFNNNGGGGNSTNSNYTLSTPLFDLALSTLLRKDFSLNLKFNLLIFLEEHSNDAVFPNLSRLLQTLKTFIQSPPNDAVSSSVSFSFKEQFLVSTTSVFISAIDGSKLNDFCDELEGLVELLLTIVNRPNHGVDRQTRGVACECLRELEIGYPCLLSQIIPHLWGLCQNERTHASQSYLLLLATVVHNVVVLKNPNVFMSNSSSIPLFPFNVPRFLMETNDQDHEKGLGKEEEMSSASYKELKRVIAFLLESPQNLTPCGVLEFMVLTMPVAKALDLQASLLKVQFSGLLYTYEPLLWHAFLMMYLRFSDSFEGHEVEIARRLLLVSKESQQHLVFRMLALHWLLGFITLLSSNRDVGKMKSVVDMRLSFYPNVFDSLAIKSLKLDLLAYCSVLLGSLNGVVDDKAVSEVAVVKLLEEGLICVSDYKWLPPWSTETAVAFRTLHKFLIGASSHSDANSSPDKALTESTTFRTIQRMLVDSMSEFQGLVPVIVGFVDRLLRCHKHHWLGESLLKTFDEHLLQKLKIDYKLGSFFPIFQRIAENDKVSPSGLIELLVKFMIFLVEKHGPDTGLKSWSQGSEVLSICRTMLIHHHSSRLFSGLSRLLGFACLYFPDLEVRDSARIYLRMLISIPGKKLREVLNAGEQLPGISPSTQSSSFFNLQPPRFSHDIKRSRSISNYIHLQRMVPLLVKQSWSLSLSTLRVDGNKPSYSEGIIDNESTSEQKDIDASTNIQVISEIRRIDQPQEPLCVMDSKISKIIEILRKHFSSIPDFRNMPGLKIRIPCTIRFESVPFIQIWGINSTCNGSNGTDSLPAMYAIVLNFSSSAPYGSIPSRHIPFLLGQAPENDFSVGQTMSLAIVPVGNDSREEESFGTAVVIDLEPREPVPSLVDVFIEANTDNGQIIKGQLQSVNVGIEDMFLKAIVPEDVPKDAVPAYYVDLFNALWEACGTSASIGRETFVLKGGKGLAAITGTRSVKLLEVPVTSLVQAVERCLGRFVVSVIGEPLVDIMKGGEMLSDIVWKDSDSDSSSDVMTSRSTHLGAGPLFLEYKDEKGERGSYTQSSRKNLGSFHILIFLPPRFHLLFQMEVSDFSTLVRIRTDHWPCLAYIDDYLEALFAE